MKEIRQLDEDEWLHLETIPLDRLVRQIAEGKIRDAKTQAAVLKVWYIQNNPAGDI